MGTEDRVMSGEVENTNNKLLFEKCMEGKWDEVVKIYEKDEKAHKAKITRSGETALHLAVSDGQEDKVENLVSLISGRDQPKEALEIHNERANTALHFAASMGSVQMCKCIASVDPSLLSIRNVDGETPLFLAVLNGRKEAFLALRSIWQKNTQNAPKSEYYSICERKDDGDTILHCAIDGDYFELAFQIIHYYGDLVNSLNKRGYSPLHCLASKPSAFKSGSSLGKFESILYYGILVDKLKVAPDGQQPSPKTDEDKKRYPKNYQTCMDCYLALIGFWKTMFPGRSQSDNEASKNTATNRAETKSSVRGQRDIEAAKNTDKNGAETKSTGSKTGDWSFPPNYACCLDLFKFVFRVLLVIFGKGFDKINKIRRKKEKHEWSAQILDELLQRASIYEYADDNGNKPQQKFGDKAKETLPDAIDKGSDDSITHEQQSSTTKGEAKQQKKGDDEDTKGETPILIAAKNGVTEMVEKILEKFPVAIHDMDANKRNIVLLAVENRQPHLYKFLLKRNKKKESIFRKVDNEGNSALHLAAKLGDNKPWLIPGEALQMHFEIKWYLYVKESMPPKFFRRFNKENKTPRQIFTETHKDLVKNGVDWLSKTSESCSLVAALIATVAFATSSSIPGGVKEGTGTPTLEDKPAFDAFSISSIIALCCSVSSMVVFLSVLTSRYQENDFGKRLPRMLIFGLTSLFLSITSMLVTFCAGHFFVIPDKLKFATFPVYAAICLPVTLFALAQFPLYLDLIWAIIKKVPRRYYKTPLK